MKVKLTSLELIIVYLQEFSDKVKSICLCLSYSLIQCLYLEKKINNGMILMYTIIIIIKYSDDYHAKRSITTL